MSQANEATDTSALQGRLRDISNIEADLKNHFHGRRLRAHRVVLQGRGRSNPVLPTDHTLVMQLGAGTVMRFDGRRQTGRNARAHRSTFIPANIAYSWQLAGPVDALQLHLDDSDLRRFARREWDVDPDRLEMHDHMGTDDSFMRGLTPTLLREISTDNASSKLVLDQFEAVVAAHMLRRYSNALDIASGQNATPKTGERDRDTVRRARELLLDRLGENISTEDLARTVGVSPFRLMRCFRSEMGISIHRFVTENRVNFVRDRLLNTDEPLVNIALDAGFANQSHMTTCYKSIMGISPGRHRRQLRG